MKMIDTLDYFKGLRGRTLLSFKNNVLLNEKTQIALGFFVFF